MNNDFRTIRRVRFDADVLPQTREWLREAGHHGNEAFVLWAGVFEDAGAFLVSTAIRPGQSGFRSHSGVGVHVSGEELFRIGRWLYANGCVLLAQVHSHPGEAYHSETDDTFPMVTAAGQFSIVVPDFARAPLTTLSNCAVYRLDDAGRWAEVPRSSVPMIFEVV